MGMIRELPPSIINQIAAGEVVERPASVVKELLENAIDAGASRIDLSVERGGKDLIRLADDGRGMDPDDLPLAFHPHATSKLAEAEDLFRIRTLGFRGEALAAIAEVSRVRCQTRTAEAPTGWEITIEAGQAGPVRECAASPGTVVEVRNLFFNTPVRRTFLKADATEAGHVSEAFLRIALAHPNQHLTFRSGDRTVYDLPPVAGLKERVAVFFGRELADSLIWVESQVASVHLWGYVAHPSQSRTSTKGQYLFVGGRYVRDRSLGHALTEAYRGLLMVGRMPVAFLHLEIPPEEVDVNVHPTKVEVRFRDSQRIYSQLLSTVRQTFLTSDLHARLQAPITPEPAHSRASGAPAAQAIPPTEGVSDPAAFGLSSRPVARQDVASWFQPSGSGGASPSFQPYPSPGYAGGPAAPRAPDWARSLPPSAPTAPADQFDEFEAGIAPTAHGPAERTSPTVDNLGERARPSLATELGPEGPSASADPARAPAAPPLKALQLHDSYLVAETADGMVVIDQHALHERILFEELRARLERGGIEAQRLLVPEPVDLSAAEAAEVLQRREELARLGLGVEPFSGDTVVVTSLPAMLPNVSPGRLLRDLAEHFLSHPLPPTPDGVLEAILSMIACKAAVKAGQRLSPEEMAALLERRHLVADDHHCPHGRPTALVFTKDELERQFGRT